VFGGSGDLGGGRREPAGSGLAAGGAGQGAVAHRRDQSASQARPAPSRPERGLAFRVPGTLIGRPYPNQHLWVVYRQVEEPAG